MRVARIWPQNGWEPRFFVNFTVKIWQKIQKKEQGEPGRGLSRHVRAGSLQNSGEGAHHYNALLENFVCFLFRLCVILSFSHDNSDTRKTDQWKLTIRTICAGRCRKCTVVRRRTSRKSDLVSFTLAESRPSRYFHREYRQ